MRISPTVGNSSAPGGNEITSTTDSHPPSSDLDAKPLHLPQYTWHSTAEIHEEYASRTRYTHLIKVWYYLKNMCQSRRGIGGKNNHNFLGYSASQPIDHEIGKTGNDQNDLTWAYLYQIISAEVCMEVHQEPTCLTDRCTASWLPQTAPGLAQG